MAQCENTAIFLKGRDLISRAEVSKQETFLYNLAFLTPEDHFKNVCKCGAPSTLACVQCCGLWCPRCCVDAPTLENLNAVIKRVLKSHPDAYLIEVRLCHLCHADIKDPKKFVAKNPQSGQVMPTIWVANICRPSLFEAAKEALEGGGVSESKGGEAGDSTSS